jgi:hypothetical protein
MVQKDGDWAWTRFKDDPQLWVTLYHSSPFDFLVDPRINDATKLALTDAGTTSDDSGTFYDPATEKRRSSRRSAPRIQYDMALFNICFGQ